MGFCKDYMKKKILGMSDTWSTSLLSHWPSEPAYYIVDCWISNLFLCKSQLAVVIKQKI